jgi:cytochrome c oxidase assembly protein subunit 15
MNQLAARPVSSRATHLLAIATVVAALPLVLLGAEVTTKGVGMVDQVSLRTPWHIFTEWMSGNGLGWFIEHGHRTFGWTVGVLALATLCVAVLRDGRRWVIALSAAGAVAVLIQGLLGIFRVQLNVLIGNSMALIHGAFAPIVLAVLLTSAAATSRAWSLGAIAESKARRLRMWSVLTIAAMYGQLILGGFIRHKDVLVAGRLHLLNAFVVFAFLWVVIKYAREADYDSFKTYSRVIMALLTVQILLGAETWMAWMKRHFLPHTAIEESSAMNLVRSAHYVVGAFLFATTVALTVKAFWAPARMEAAR